MDWKATLEEILAERRARFGERPSPDDFIALRAGQLSPDERQRLLEQAAVDPELGRELFDILRFPELAADEDPAADEDGVDERWLALRERLTAEGDLPARELSTSSTAMPSATVPSATVPAPVPTARRLAWLPLAAMFLLGVGMALMVGRFGDSEGPGPSAEARLNLPIVELLPHDTTRARGGREVVILAPDAGGLVLALAVPGLATTESGLATTESGLATTESVPGGGSYTLELTRGDGTTATVGGLRPGIGGVFVLDLPRRDWTDGLHQLRLKDDDGRPVADFQVEVELRR